MERKRVLGALLGAICLLAGGGAARATAAFPEKEASWLDKLRHLKDRDAERVLVAAEERIAEGLAGDALALARELAALAASDVRAEGERAASPRHRKAKGSEDPAEPAVFPLPSEIMYRFGTRDLVALKAAPKKLAAAIRSGRPITASLLSARNRLEKEARGCPGESERIHAGILRALDVYRGADAYAQFLESWRNPGPHGDESFYEALDRTAGTPAMLFFYDAMLDDFVDRFAPEEGAKWDLVERHDKNQQCFLTYRQYRGLIEAVAYSLWLPPDEPLPSRLARYDYQSAPDGRYSLRHQVDILVGYHGGPAAVVREFADFLRDHPPPDPLWLHYDPLGEFGAAFRARVPALIESTGLSTDALGERARERRMALARLYRAGARDAISSAR